MSDMEMYRQLTGDALNLSDESCRPILHQRIGMAYANYLASANWDEIASLRSGFRATIAPTEVITISHLYARAVQVQPLGGRLEEVLDGGEVLSPSFWHPLRVPVVHTPNGVRALATNLRAALTGLETRGQKEHVNDTEVAGVLLLLEHAAQSNLAVVSVLEPPADLERARRVICPFIEPEKLPIPWGNLAVTLKRFLKRR
jgi:hypothetical protein